MRRIFFIALLLYSLPYFSQNDSGLVQPDTSGALDILYKEAKKKDLELHGYKRFGVSIFAGMGKGGNDIKKGFALGFSARTHYMKHTFNLYWSQARKAEQLYGTAETYSLFSNNIGLIYGPGTHTKNFTASFGAGIGYYNTIIDRHIVSVGKPTYAQYSRVAACFGAQACIHEKLFGVTFQVFYNTANPYTNSTILGGVEFILK